MALPELTPDDADGRPPDVIIAWGGIPARLPQARDVAPSMQVAGDDFLLDAPAGRYRVRGGAAITIDPRPGASDRDIRLYLLGTVMGALCHQRAVLPLHATAIDTAAGAVAFAGPSGAGKSTLAAQFQQRGGLVLADDLCAVQADSESPPTVLPGLARIKLWRDSLTQIGQPADLLGRIGEDIDKFNLPTAGARAPGPRVLDRLYILRPDASGEVVVRRLGGPEAVSALVANIYRWPLAAAMGRGALRFGQAVALAGRRPVFELAYTHDAATPFKLLDAVERHWADRRS